jgi:hypothetical protein
MKILTFLDKEGIIVLGFFAWVFLGPFIQLKALQRQALFTFGRPPK